MSMIEWLATYVVINIAVFFFSIFCWENFSFVNPFVIYKNISMNWFGVILLTVLLNISFPLVSICYWFYKLVTVGRKDN